MLTADHVRAFKYKDELKIRQLKGHQRSRALSLAAEMIKILEGCQGVSRSEIDVRLDALGVSHQDHRVAQGLRKLVLDRCDFGEHEELDVTALRRDLFTLASTLRLAHEDRDTFRETVFEHIAKEYRLPVDAIESLLYSDLKSAQVLMDFRSVGAESLLERYDDAQCQAVLLKAKNVVLTLKDLKVGTARAFFRSLKFRRLLFTAEKIGKAEYRIEIDGPHSLFRSLTKYGLQLALLYPSIRELGTFHMVAEVYWGKDKEHLRFELQQDGEPVSQNASRPPDDVRELMSRFKALKSNWSTSVSKVLLNVPGSGLCVPDLVFTHQDSGKKVYLEVLGFWSREAVWRRVDMVEKGLSESIVFALSDRLRVSEKALDGASNSRLYVYKGVMNAGRILAMLDSLD